MASIPPGETGFDQTLHFTVPGLNVRGRAVRLGPVLDTILSAHTYPAPVRRLLAEALALTALLGALLKDDDGQLTIQAQTQDGVIDLLVCDHREAALRGYALFDRARLDDLGPNPDLHALFGDGFLAITFDLTTTDQRYQGIVPLEGVNLTEACERYFLQSEQVPTLIRVATTGGADGMIAAGLLLQHLPEGEEGRERLHARLDHPDWEHASILGAAISAGELVDPALGLESLVWRLFHAEPEVRVHQGPALVRGCRCSVEHFKAVLSRFGPDQRREMADSDGLIVVDCAFCSRQFPVDLDGPEPAGATDKK